MKTVDSMSPERQLHNVPLDEDVWMMTLFFGYLSHSISEFNCFYEILELVLTPDLIVSIFIDSFPPRNRWKHLIDLRTKHGWNSTPTWSTFQIREISSGLTHGHISQIEDGGIYISLLKGFQEWAESLRH